MNGFRLDDLATSRRRLEPAGGSPDEQAWGTAAMATAHAILKN
jgi:hypothetical protein